MPLLYPLPSQPPSGDQGRTYVKKHGTLQATKGHQRSQSSCGGGSTSPGCPRQDSMEPSDEDVGTGGGGSEHLSETLNSLSLTSLLTPHSLSTPLMKKCNSTGSLDQTNVSARGKDGRQFYTIDAQGYLSNPWTECRVRDDEEDGDVMSRRHVNTSCRKNR